MHGLFLKTPYILNLLSAIMNCFILKDMYFIPLFEIILRTTGRFLLHSTKDTKLSLLYSAIF